MEKLKNCSKVINSTEKSIVRHLSRTQQKKHNTCCQKWDPFSKVLEIPVIFLGFIWYSKITYYDKGGTFTCIKKSPIRNLNVKIFWKWQIEADINLRICLLVCWKNITKFWWVFRKEYSHISEVLAWFLYVTRFDLRFFFVLQLIFWNTAAKFKHFCNTTWTATRRQFSYGPQTCLTSTFLKYYLIWTCSHQMWIRHFPVRFQF